MSPARSRWACSWTESENADVDLYNINHGGNKLGVKVVGGPAAKAGKEPAGRVVIFSGSSSNNELSYAVENGGRLLVRDIWYESGQYPRFMQCRRLRLVHAPWGHGRHGPARTESPPWNSTTSKAI